MAQNARFFDGVGYTESEYAEVQNRLLPEGVIRGAGSELVASAPGGMTVRVGPGEAHIQGFWFQNTANVDLAVAANSSGSTRTDAVVLRLNRVTNTAQLVLVPNAPAPTRTPGGDWEMTLWTVSVPNGAGAITSGNLTDQRSGTNCGYTGRGIVSKGTGRSDVGVANPYDRDTGLHFPTGPDVVEVVAGGNAGAIFNATTVLIGSDAAITGVTVGRAGGTVAANGAWTFGGTVSFGTSIALPLTLASGAAHADVGISANDTFVSRLTLQNATTTKQFIALLGTAAGQGFGGSGDASIYTAGTSAGRLMLGTAGLLRMILGTGGAVSVGNVEGAARLNVMQAANTAGSGLRLYNSNVASYWDVYSNVTGALAFTVVGGVHALHIDSTTRNICIGSVATYNARLTINQDGAGEVDGFRMIYGGGIGKFYMRSDGHLSIGSAGGNMIVHHNGTAISPSVDQGMHLGIASLRWAQLYCVGVNCSGPVTGTTYTGTSFAATGAVSGASGSFTGSVSALGFTAGGTISANGGISGASLSVTGQVSAATLTTTNVSGNLTPTADNTGAVGVLGTMWNAVYTHNGLKPGGGSWTATSDDRTKVASSFRPFRDGLDVVRRLQPIYYRYNGKYGTPKGAEFVGFRAHEVEEVVPAMVGRIEAAATPGDEPEEILTVDTSRLEYLLLNAVKELAERVEALERRN